MPFCGWDRSCYTTEGWWGDPELGCPRCDLPKPRGPELSPHAPSARSRVGNLSNIVVAYTLTSVQPHYKITYLFFIPQIKHDPKMREKNKNKSCLSCTELIKLFHILLCPETDHPSLSLWAMNGSRWEEIHVQHKRPFNKSSLWLKVVT